MTEEGSKILVKKYQDKFQLTDKQFLKWAGKRYIVLIGVKDIKGIKSFTIDKSNYGNMDDWLPVEKIETVK